MDRSNASGKGPRYKTSERCLRNFSTPLRLHCRTLKLVNTLPQNGVGGCHGGTVGPKDLQIWGPVTSTLHIPEGPSTHISCQKVKKHTVWYLDLGMGQLPAKSCGLSYRQLGSPQSTVIATEGFYKNPPKNSRGLKGFRVDRSCIAASGAGPGGSQKPATNPSCCLGTSCQGPDS